MQNNVISFKIDHTKLLPGVYLHEVKEIEPNVYLTTFDLRFKKPNQGDYLSPIASHSLEHILATFYSDYYPQEKIYVGPMGCLTGFYLVFKNKQSVDWLINTFDQLNEFINSLIEVPAKSEYRCGNYQMLSLSEGQKAWNEFYANKNNWGKQYPLLDK